MERRKRLKLFLVLFLALGFLVIIGLCAKPAYLHYFEPPPGTGRKAEKGYQACEPIIDALARYHTRYSSYPETLDLLVPEFLSDVSFTDEDIRIYYRLTENSYKLAFDYIGPGMNWDFLSR